MEAYIKNACEQFEKLLREQLARSEKMKQAAPATDFANAKKIVVGIVDGDGIGPIIMKEAVKVAEKLLADEISSGKIEIRKVDGLTIENRLAKNQAVPTEVLAALKQGKSEIAMLPQPAATNATKAVEGLRIAIDLNAEWAKIDSSSALVTGVLVVNTKFAEENPGAVKILLEDYEKSCKMVTDDLDKTADYLVQFKIGNITSKEIAKIAIPKCNIKYMDGEEMKAAVSGYLKILFESDPTSIGGELPKDSLYYVAK